ncbi:hypothetical protein BXU08_07960 [Sphingomonas sp. LM7]|nr:hypothetical protein BXU08_07960 [Sphingomonas sp. LM7]
MPPLRSSRLDQPALPIRCRLAKGLSFRLAIVMKVLSLTTIPSFVTPALSQGPAAFNDQEEEVGIPTQSRRD